jgi:hypothetical protein
VLAHGALLLQATVAALAGGLAPVERSRPSAAVSRKPGDGGCRDVFGNSWCMPRGGQSWALLAFSSGDLQVVMALLPAAAWIPTQSALDAGREG